VSLRQIALNKERVKMNSRRQTIKVGIVVLIVVLLGMMLTHRTNTSETKSVKSEVIEERLFWK
jgi:hypothetical protein